MATKKKYTCPLIGLGTEDDPIRPKIMSYQPKNVEVISLTADQCVVSVVADDYTVWNDDVDIVEI